MVSLVGKKLMNIEHRIMYSVYFKKAEQAYSAEKATKVRSKTALRNSIRLSWTGYIRPELIEGYSSQAAGLYSVVCLS
jgi:hypothetical protein